MLIESVKAPATSSRAFSPLGKPVWIIALLCLPTLLFVWFNRDVPHFGVLQDDGLYFGSAKSIAAGTGYKVLSIPSTPAQTKYPPLYPLWLSLAWRMQPAYPASLSIALLLTWLCLPVVLALIYQWCRRQGFPAPVTWLVTGLFALNPYVLFFAANLVSEIFFMVFLFGAIWAAEQPRPHGWKWPLLAGAIAGLAFLARTAGVALLPAALVYYAWKKNYRGALGFALGMLPAVAGWTLWTRAHAAPGRDVVTMCYTNYVAYQFYNVGWDNFVQVLWNNVDALLLAMGSLVFPQVLTGLPAKLILEPLGVAMILGCVRMARRHGSLLYPLFGVVSLAMLLVWHFQPNQRFILPVAPLLLTGFCFEMGHLAGLLRGALRHRDRSQRVVAYGFAGVLGLLLACGAGFQVYMSGFVMPEVARHDRQNAAQFGRLYQWIAGHLPGDAAVLWESDTALYFGSGHAATNYVVPPREWYATGGEDGAAQRYERVDSFARQHNLAYVGITKVGLQRNESVLRVLAANPNLESVYEDSGAILYRVR